MAGCALAVAAFRRSDVFPRPPVALEPPRHSALLYLASLPGALALALASWLHERSSVPDANATRLWILGVVLLVLPGLGDAFRRFSRRKPSAETLRLAAAAVLLFALAFGIRVAGGIDRIPGWIDEDEWATGIEARAALAEGTRGIFEFWGMGNPRMAPLVSQLAARPFGHGLRALRLGAALLGSLTIVLLFDFGRRLVGAPAAFVAALLAATNHVLIHWSRVGQIYVETPFFTSLALAFLLRALTGGSFLMLTLAGIAIALGTVTYIGTLILPFLALLTLAGWAILLQWRKRRILATAAYLAAIVVLMVLPFAITVAQITPEIALQRIPAIALLRPEGPGILAESYGAKTVPPAVAEHFVRTIGVFNFGSDWFHAYGAHRAMLDPLTAALAPLAFALLLGRLSSPLGWLVTVFVGAYLAAGAFLLSTPPTYHRIAVVVLFACLAVGWALAGFGRRWTESGARPWKPAVLAGFVVLGSAGLNLHHYFRQEPRVRALDAEMSVGRWICGYSASHAVIDATGFSGTDHRFAQLDCPAARPVRVGGDRIQDFLDTAEPKAAIVILSAATNAERSEEFRSYRLVRRWEDRSIGYPTAVALSILELERRDP